MNNKYKLAIFDMDGTILDTLDDLTDSVNQALKSKGYPTRDREEIRGFLGNGIKRLIELAVPEGTSREDEEQILQRHKTYYDAHCAEKTKPYEGIPDLIRRLRQRGILTAVVSNKGDSAVQELAKQYFPGLFDLAMGQREGLARKPARDMVDAVIEEMGVAHDECIYIGDSDVDLQTAINAELPCISVLWGFRDRKTLEAAGAADFATTPEEVDRWFV